MGGERLEPVSPGHSGLRRSMGLEIVRPAAPSGSHAPGTTSGEHIESAGVMITPDLTVGAAVFASAPK